MFKKFSFGKSKSEVALPQVDTPAMSAVPTLAHNFAATYEEGEFADAFDEDEKEDLDGLKEDAYTLMAEHLFNRAVSERLTKATSETDVVSLRRGRGQYISYPEEVRDFDLWLSNISQLNVESAIKISSTVIAAVLRDVPSFYQDVPLDAQTKIQLLDTIEELGSCKRNQKAAFIRDEGCLILWSDEAEKLLDEAHVLTNKLMVNVWNARRSPNGQSRKNSMASPYGQFSPPMSRSGSQANFTPMLSPSASIFGDMEKFGMPLNEKGEPISEEIEIGDVKPRPVQIFAPITTAFSIMLALSIVGLGIGEVLKEYLLDGQGARFALIVTLPFTILIAAFFLLFIISQIWQMFGPVAQLKTNSLFYSGAKPTRRPAVLPAFTIVMPVYKESLEGVIKPTVESLKAAVTTYERQGGSVRILICEDGMQVLSAEDQLERREYYEQQDIAWVARPPHNKDGYIRKGKFKKASNMNYALELSLRVEEILETLKANPELDPFTTAESLYNQALALAIDETDGKAWASGNIRLAELHLIVDCDTRIPTDCLMDAGAEMAESPDLAILQHESGVLTVMGHYFERGIAFFTERVNKNISYACSNGEVAPFVGHNAFLRWSAMQDAAFVDEDGNRKIWSESHVSEDFDMSMRLQLRNWTVRWASYSNGEFKEGVSLSVVDEINRWQKYAYGCQELLFRPLSKWHTGPISPLARNYLYSSVPLHSKISVFAYIFSYYAIASSLLLTVMHWAVEGILIGQLDGFYNDSWEIWLTVLVVFIGFGNFSSAILTYRRRDMGFLQAFTAHAKWVPFFFLFFSGLSYHLSTSIVSHLIGYNMVWEGTIKDANVSNFFEEVPAILKRFWVIYTICFFLIAAMIIMSLDFIPLGYRIYRFIDIVPLSCAIGGHVLAPIFLNPWLMHFHF